MMGLYINLKFVILSNIFRIMESGRLQLIGLVSWMGRQEMHTGFHFGSHMEDQKRRDSIKIDQKDMGCEDGR
jgi:hypothetical protein